MTDRDVELRREGRKIAERAALGAGGADEGLLAFGALCAHLALAEARDESVAAALDAAARRAIGRLSACQRRTLLGPDSDGLVYSRNRNGVRRLYDLALIATPERLARPTVLGRHAGDLLLFGKAGIR